MKRNPNMGLLRPNYLFSEILLRKNQFLATHQDAVLISLGIGDTTQPITPTITNTFIQTSQSLGTQDGYTGYGSEQGLQPLCDAIAKSLYNQMIEGEEVFVSDGAKCDLGRIQMLFGKDVSIAVQDPAYPVYIEGSMIQGIQRVIPMPCSPENDFFPDLRRLPRTDLIYFCSPNNPTGATATREQLEQLVAFAAANRSILIFDAAYAAYIQDKTKPKTIYEIEGAKKVAIEIGSFSKMAGFSGIRLGWTIFPMELQYDDGNRIWSDWKRLTSTIFNGASLIAQRGGCAALTAPGLQEISMQIGYYLENTRILKEAVESLGYPVAGGDHAPYIWVHFPGEKSWDVFQRFLEQYHLLATPGSGFGPSGESFLRFSAFAQREAILKAAQRLKRGAF